MTLMEMEWELACVTCQAMFELNTSTNIGEGKVICPHCNAWSGHTYTKLLICSTRTTDTTDIVGFCVRCKTAVYLNTETRGIKKRYCVPCAGWLMRDEILKTKRRFAAELEKRKPLTN